jgi:hypothetical protein
MSGNFFQNKREIDPQALIAVQDILLEYILSNKWEDYEDFVRELSEWIIGKSPKTEKDLLQYVKSFSHSFYCFNEIDKKSFLNRLPLKKIINRLSKLPKQEKRNTSAGIIVISDKPKIELPPLTPSQVLPETKNVTIAEAKQLIDKMSLPERIIQDALRDALRERGATNITERKSDTSLEVADLEDFSLKIGKKWYSFTSVVKGYKSLSKKLVRWEDIAHQVTKAYQGTEPDYILLVLAKDVVDGVISQFVEYGKTVGKRNLIILIDPINLARFLNARKII